MISAAPTIGTSCCATGEAVAGSTMRRQAIDEIPGSAPDRHWTSAPPGAGGSARSVRPAKLSQRLRDARHDVARRIQAHQPLEQVIERWIRPATSSFSAGSSVRGDCERCRCRWPAATRASMASADSSPLARRSPDPPQAASSRQHSSTALPLRSRRGNLFGHARMKTELRVRRGCSCASDSRDCPGAIQLLRSASPASTAARPAPASRYSPAWRRSDAARSA